MALRTITLAELGVTVVFLAVCSSTTTWANGAASTMLFSENMEVTVDAVTKVSKITTENMVESGEVSIDTATTEANPKKSSAMEVSSLMAASPTSNILPLANSKPISASHVVANGTRSQVTGIVHSAERTTFPPFGASGYPPSRREIGSPRTSTPRPLKTPLPDAVSLLDTPSRSSKPLCPMSQALRVDSASIPPVGQIWHFNGSDWFCPCNVKPCLWMCCPKGEMYNSTTACVSAIDKPLYLEVVDSLQKVRKASLTEYYLRFEEICPGRKLMLDPGSYPDDNYTVFENGTLYVPSFTVPIYGPGQFCVSFINNSALHPAVLSCMMTEETPEIKQSLLVYSCCMIFSLPFLVATFLTYALLPRLQNLHGKIVMSHVAVLFIAYLSLIIVQMNTHNFPDWACIFTGMFASFLIKPEKMFSL